MLSRKNLQMPLAFPGGIWYNQSKCMKGGLGMESSRRIGFFSSVPVFLGVEVLKRILRVLYAAFSSDVLYSSSPLPDILYWVAAGVEMIALALAVGTVAAAVKHSVRKGAALVGLSLGVLLFDGVLAFLIDLWQHNIAGVEAYAALNLLIQMIEPAALLVLGFVFAVVFRRAGKTDAGRCFLTVGVLAAIYTAARLAAVAVDIAEFFRIYRYPTAAEVTAMITDVVSVLLLCGVLFFGMAYITVRFWQRFDDRKESSHS